MEKAVNKLDAVRKAEVSLMTNSMTVDYDESALTPDGIIQAVVHAGYGASLPQKAGDTTQAKTQRPETQMEAELSSMKHRLIWSFVFLLPLFYISMGHMFGAPLPGFLTGLENAVAFGPSLPGSKSCGAHGPDERLFIEEMFTASRIYARTILALAGEKA